MPDLLNIGTSALVAFQRALTTVSHNISNVHTEGYSRQRVELGTRVPERSGAGYFGTGVDVMTVRRSYDQFLTSQLRTQSSAQSRLETYYDFASQIDNLVADPDAGLTPALEEFFGAVQDLANDPTSMGARQNLLATADTMAARFHSMNDRFDETQRRVNSQIDTVVTEINRYAESIAELNKQIAAAKGAAGGNPPNDLLDKRDQALKELSERVSISVVEQDDGMMNVFIGTGQGVVVGPTVTKLTSIPDPARPDRREISIGGATTGPYVTQLMSGGTLGGLLDFQREVLDPTQRTLGQIAISLAFTFNDQHHLGLDLNNNIGGDFFDPAVYTNIAGIGNTNNTGNLAVSMDITNVAQLTGEDYQLRFTSPTNFVLEKLSDGSAVGSGTYDSATGAFNFAAPAPQLGFSLEGVVGSAPAANDTFVLRPTASGSRDIDVILTDPRKIAAALPLRATVNVGNAGRPTISEFTVTRNPAAPFTDPSALQIAGNLTMAYDQATGLYTLTPPAGYTVVPATIAYDPLTDDGRKQTVTLQDGAGNLIDLNFKLGGTPRTGDLITIAPNNSGAGDNGNALALGNLQTKLTMLNGTADYQTVYASLVANVGTLSHSADMNLEVAHTMYDHALESRDAISGVNLDEEAAKLLQFQQAYMASTKMITVADTLFQSLLGSVGR